MATTLQWDTRTLGWATSHLLSAEQKALCMRLRHRELRRRTTTLESDACPPTARYFPLAKCTLVTALKKSWTQRWQPFLQMLPSNTPISRSCLVCRRSWSGFISTTALLRERLPKRCTMQSHAWQRLGPDGSCYGAVAAG